MELLTWLEVAFGLALLYVLLSLVASGMAELIAALLGLRAKDLTAGLQALLGDDAFAKFKAHPLIAGLRVKNDRNLSYIPARLFALAMLDLKNRGALGESGGVAHALNLLEDPKRVEAWFDDAMERVSDAYKRRTQLIIFLLGALLASWMNADTIRIARALYRNAPMRAAVTAAAEKGIELHSPMLAEQSGLARTGAAAMTVPAVDVGGAPPPNQALEDVRAATAQLQKSIDILAASQLPIGWEREYWESIHGAQWLLVALGLLLTTLAISLGAPFWFDVIGRLLAVRPKLQELAEAEAGKEKAKA